jgi:hypothetical protein
VAIQASHDILKVLQQKQPSTPLAHIGNDQLEAIKQIADIFNNHIIKQEPDKHHETYQPIPPKLPRVQAPRKQTLPRVPVTQTRAPTHRYPTRNVISQTQDEANHIEQVTPTAARLYLQKRANTVTPTDESLYVQQWANTIIDPDTGASMEYRHLIKHPKYSKLWEHSFSNEIGRLAQGVGGRIKGTDTINFIEYNKVPIDRRKDVTYGNIQVDYRPQKAEENRTRLTVGGNLLIDFPGDVSTPTADITTTKMVINSTISTPKAKYMRGDIKNFYLGTTCDSPSPLYPKKSSMNTTWHIWCIKVLYTLKYAKVCMGSHKREYSPINY